MRGYKNFEGNPHPGDLREKIDIGRTVNVIGENGYPSGTDTVICTVWAGLTDAGNEAFRSADATDVRSVVNFVIRYREDIENGMWVKYKGEKYYIQAIGQYGFLKTYLGLRGVLDKEMGA